MDNAAQPPSLQSLTREQFWQHHIDQWQDSGSTKMAYCREYRLTYHQMVYWCSKRDGLSKHDEPTSGFVPVSVSSPVTSGSSQLSVRLPSGISIEGINELTLDMVAQLVRSL
jgi:hypothetical protein